MSERDDDRTIAAGGISGSDDRTLIVGGGAADRTIIVDHGPATSTDRTVIAGAAAAPAGPTIQAMGHNALEVGTKIGEFEVTGLVGEGGFGIVYLAYDHSLERQVAIKEYMPSELAHRADDGSVIVRSQRHAETFGAGMRSFINEARLLAQFDHPSLLKVYRFWEANGTAYMVMPFYEGVTLKGTLKDLDDAPDESWIKSLLSQLLDALEIIHSRQCYHRDIAPDNILILPDETPLLLDFGAARRVIGDMTQALTVILKPGYAPIEQYAEVPNMKQGPWTDLYALASVVYFAIEGKAPVPAVARVMSDPLVPLAQSAAGRYSDSFLRAVDRALSVRPDDRPQNIAEFRQLLGFVERTTATRYLPASTERRAPEDRIAPAAKAASPAAAPASAASAPAKAAARSRKPLIIAGAATAAAALVAFVFFVVMDDAAPPAASTTAKSAPATPASGSAAPAASAADVNAKLAGFDCAKVDATVNGASATVRGHVSREADLQRIDSELGALGIAKVSRSAVQVVPPPHCQVAAALAPYAGNPGEGPTIALKSGGTAASEGQKLVTAIGAAGFAGYVYADLYDTEGNVVHMMPNPKERNNRVEAKQRTVLGEDGLFGMQWDLVPPFGKHMLVVMQSQSPLFLPKTRPEVEKAGAYLNALRDDLAKMPAGDKFVVGYSLFDFQPKK
jgi:serine/threonine protein kinase